MSGIRYRSFVLTAGIKYGDYQMNLNQYQDAKIVGCLGGKAGTDFVTGAPICIGGPAFVNQWEHSATGCPTSPRAIR